VLAAGDNRLELLLVEAQEERDRLLHALLMVLGVVAFAFLAGVAFTVAIVVLMWNRSPIAALAVLSCLYGAAALFLYHRLVLLRRGWTVLPETVRQLRKDREALEKCLT
jgi:uncharacterized membrane protein YqjE